MDFGKQIWLMEIRANTPLYTFLKFFISLPQLFCPYHRDCMPNLKILVRVYRENLSKILHMRYVINSQLELIQHAPESQFHQL